ncbi:MAG: MGMT family protein [Bifidobacteriaceae bacterium]|jgi:methylated-DNA-protein-cysteine methyltransferase-like protein|nr:MGMT family protein [Bifidobacteriaceae bacterium]
MSTTIDSSHTADAADAPQVPNKESFAERVYAAVRKIPRGSVATYGQIARMIGAPRSARYVGFALHRNPYEGDVPCHRVVFRDGGVAPGFAFGGPQVQRTMLEKEGVAFLKKLSSHDLPCVDLSQSGM